MKKRLIVMGGVVSIGMSVTLMSPWAMDELQNMGHSVLSSLHLDRPQIRPDLAKEETLRKERQLFFKNEVLPVIVLHDSEVQEATRRFFESVQDIFDRAREGVPRFVDTMHGWGAKWKLTQGFIAGWWSDEDKTSTYIEGEFSKHVIQSSQVEQELRDAFARLQEEVQQSQARQHAHIKAAIEQNGTLSLDLEDWVGSLNRQTELMLDLSSQEGRRAIADGNKAILVSTFSGMAVEGIVRAAIMRLGVTLATGVANTATTAGGATVGGAASGGAGGSLAGPAGTVVGVAAGFAVGMVIDWWMTRSSKENLNQQLTQMIDELQNSLMIGDKVSPGLMDQVQGHLKQYLHENQKIIRQSILLL